MSDLMPQSGRALSDDRDQADPQRTGTPQNHVSGGNVWPALTSRGHVSRVPSGPSFHRRTEPSSGPNVVHLLASRSLVHQWWSSRAWNLRSSGFCSFVTFGAPSLPLTFVATTGQLVGGQGCWDVEGSRWRVQQLASAERQEEGLSQRPRG